MHAEDVLFYGNQTVLHTIDGLTDAQADVAGVCGYWSVRQIIGHLASHELVLVDILNGFIGDAPTPNLAAYLSQGLTFNDAEVEKRSRLPYAETVREYEAAAAQSRELISKIPVERRRQAGSIPWYGSEYDLEDLIAYSNYAHKREHCAQINVYKDTLKR